MADIVTILDAPVQARVPTPRIKRWRRRLVRLILATPLLALVGWLLCILLGENIHVVVPDQVYRSSQPTPEELRELVRSHGIRTIVNLRGTCYPQDWYIEEARTAQQLGLSLEDICFSAGRWPSTSELRTLVEVLDQAERPLLLHCRHGADRTGLASAVLLLLTQEIELDDALYQMSARFGHLPIGRSSILDRFFDLYSHWLQQSQTPHSRTAFRRWLLEEYRGGQCQYVMEEATRTTREPKVGLPVNFQVRLRNTSPFPWNFSAGLTAGMHVGFTLRRQDSEDRDFDSGRSGLVDAVVLPGELFTVQVVVPPLVEPGRYRIRIDMIEEGHCWFFQTGMSPYEEEFDVRE